MRGNNNMEWSGSSGGVNRLAFKEVVLPPQAAALSRSKGAALAAEPKKEPTLAEIQTAFGLGATGDTGVLKKGDSIFFCWAVAANWYWVEGVKAV